MSTGIAHRRPAASSTGSESRYERAWTTVALIAAAVWIAVAVLQTPRLPLLGVAIGVGAIGGTLFVKARVSSPRGRRQYLNGALLVAGLVLVIVGFGHHLEAGLVTVALLLGSSPSVLRWIAKS
jgi:hypothetical protein